MVLLTPGKSSDEWHLTLSGREGRGRVVSFDLSGWRLVGGVSAVVVVGL